MANLSAKFAEKIGFGEWGMVLGMLHDKGKEQQEFQRYIRKVSGYMPEIKNVERTPHAYVGALMARQLYPQFSPLLSMPIMAHHAGLYDYTDFIKRMEAELPTDIKCENSMNLVMPKDKSFMPQDVHHLVRVLYSCLVDADFLDTEEFMDNKRSESRKKQKTINELLALGGVAPHVGAWIEIFFAFLLKKRRFCNYLRIKLRLKGNSPVQYRVLFQSKSAS